MAYQPPNFDPYAQRNAVLAQLAQRPNDFPNLGMPVPVGSNKAVNGVVPSTNPANWTSPPQGQLKAATPEQLAGMTPNQRSLYDNALAHPGQVTDPYKYATTDFAKLGERKYLDTMQGGSTWEQLYGPPPAGYVYNANGGLMKRPLMDKIDSVMQDVAIGAMTGGIGAASMAPTIAGSALANFRTDQIDPNMRNSASQRMAAGTDASYVDGSNLGTQSTSGMPAAGVNNATGTQSSQASDGAGGAAGATGDTSQWDTNGYAKPGYVAPKPGSAPLAGYDGAKWNDPNHQSPKYVVGRILSQYPQTTEGLTQAMAEIEKAYPGAKQNGDDTISIPGVSTSVDVVKAGGGFWWNPETDENGNPYPKDQGGEGAGGGSGGGYNASGDVATSDIIAKIVARLGAMAGGQGQGAGIMSARDALLQQFGA